MKTMKIILIALLIISGSFKIFAQQPAVVLSDKTGWHKIGETTVNFTSDKDEILLIGANRFSAVKIKVTDASINLKSFEIYFDNDSKQNVAIGKDIKAPGETSIVQLDGNGERVIKKVIFTYSTTSNNTGNKAHVELWGLKTNPDK